MKKISFVLCTIVAFFLLLNYTSQNTDIIHETKNDITKKSNTKDNIGKNSDLNKKSPFSAVKILRNTIYISFDDKKPSTWHTLLSLNNIGADALMNFAKTHYGERFCDYKIECYKFHIIKHIYKVYKDFQNEELPDHVPVELSEASVNQNGMDVENTHEKYLLNKKNFVENIGLSKNRNIRTPNGVVGTINHLPPNVLGTSGNTNEISKKITHDITSRIGHTYDKIRGYLGNLGKSFHNIPLRMGFGHTNSTLTQNLNNNKNFTISTNSHVVPLKAGVNKIIRIPISHKNDELERKNKLLQDEVNSLKTKVSNIDKQEVVMEKSVNKKIEELQQELEAEKRIIDNTQKREIVAALIGGTIIGLTIVALLFVCSCYRKYK